METGRETPCRLKSGMDGTMSHSRMSDAQGPFPGLMSRPFDERVRFLSGTSRDLRIQTDGLP
jgi:hypothetical protein